MAQEAAIVRRNISLDIETDAILEQKALELARQTGLEPNYSAAVRFIVRDWASIQPSPNGKKAAQ